MARELANLKHAINFIMGKLFISLIINIQHIDQSNESRERLACQKNKIAPSHYFIEMYISSH